MRLQIVCPEHCAFEGEAAFVVLPATTGEFGIAPMHASEICTLEAGYVRVSEHKMGTVDKVIAVEGGYAQVADDTVIVLAERAFDLADVDREDVERRMAEFGEQLSALAPEDVHRAYIYNEVAWCKLLLSYEPRS